MTAAYEELIHLLDEREIGYSASDDQAIRTDLRGEVATYRIVAKVEAEADLFQVFGYSPLRVPEGCRPAIMGVVACGPGVATWATWPLGRDPAGAAIPAHVARRSPVPRSRAL